ncbi:uncharacterized protein LOC117595287 [Esox lucius]|uniref:uncharacterized protein LOC117595287 n=1 Tax=Esox lucius TaxID=8010 RepID=UPI001476FF88|nr:uncharacterized protein LOC117595287 [Esox lucius]
MQSRKLGDVVDLSGSMFEQDRVEDPKPNGPSAKSTVSSPIQTQKGESGVAPQMQDILLSVTPEKLKPYRARCSTDSSFSLPVQPAVSSVAAVVLQPGTTLEENDDGLVSRHTLQQCERLSNSEMLKTLPLIMGHLNKDQMTDLIALLNCFLTVFQDVPSRTSVLEHDVDVGDTAPIRQHPYRVNARKREILKALPSQAVSGCPPDPLPPFHGVPPRAVVAFPGALPAVSVASDLLPASPASLGGSTWIAVGPQGPASPHLARRPQ